jgi:hypothetical protein
MRAFIVFRSDHAFVLWGSGLQARSPWPAASSGGSPSGLSYNERGPRLFRTCTKRIVVWIGRRVACYADVYELRLLSKEIDHLADKVAPNTESREDILIFRNNVLADEPGEGRMLDPVAEKRRARILSRASGLESRYAGDEHRSVDNSLGRFSRRANGDLRQSLLRSPVAADCRQDLGLGDSG